jgi:hypothetical protein
MISVERLRELLEYDGERLIWKVTRPGTAAKGRPAGSLVSFPHGLKYMRLKIDGQCHRAHRVIWALVYGEWPANHIDHIDGNGLNNRIENLRDVDPAGNAKNRKRYDRNTSGFSGVTWREGRKRWLSRIRVNGRLIHLGYFVELEDARDARSKAEALYGFHPNHGESRRMNIDTLATTSQHIALGIGGGK